MRFNKFYLLVIFFNLTVWSATYHFIENFNDTTYKDEVLTTANWDTTDGSIKLNKDVNEQFIDFSPRLVGFGTSDIRCIASTGSIVLIGGGVVGVGPKLNKYDITKDSFTDLSSGLIGFGANRINAIATNGEYFLIVGGDGAINKYLISTGEFINLTGQAGTASHLSVAYSAGYFIIGGVGGRLYRYDGATFTDLTTNVGTGHIWAVAGNGSYFLIGGVGPVLYRYDPELDSFTNLTPRLAGFGTNAIKSICWNGSYWLIGGAGPSLNIYDVVQDTFTDVKSKLSNFGTNSIETIAWTGSYWLIGGGGGRLNACFDISLATFTDLTGSLVDFGAATIRSINSFYTDVTSTESFVGGDGAKLNKRFFPYSPQGIVQSTKINTTNEIIEKGILTAIDELRNQTIEYFLSANGGNHWEKVILGSTHTFYRPGRDLRWKAILTTTAPLTTPLIKQIKLVYFTDTVPPSAITDLKASSGETEGAVILTWSAPGDDGKEGRALSYTVKYATYGPIDLHEWWNKATIYPQSWIPEEPMNIETRTLFGLMGKNTYYIVIRTQDDVSNWSDLSNVAVIFVDDTSPPAAPKLHITLPNGMLIGSNETIVISGFTEPGATVEKVILKDQNGNILTYFTDMTGFDVSADGYFRGEINTGNLLDNRLITAITIEVIVKDHAGNLSPAGKSGYITVKASEDFFQLYDNLFNPTKNDEVIINYGLTNASRVNIKVYNLIGELVKDIVVNEVTPPGRHFKQWNGRNEDKKLVSSGIYLIYFEADSGARLFRDIKKVAVIK